MEGLSIVPIQRNLIAFGPKQNQSPTLEEGKRSHSLVQIVFEITTTFHDVRITVTTFGPFSNSYLNLM